MRKPSTAREMARHAPKMASEISLGRESGRLNQAIGQASSVVTTLYMFGMKTATASSVWGPPTLADIQVMRRTSQLHHWSLSVCTT